MGGGAERARSRNTCPGEDLGMGTLFILLPESFGKSLAVPETGDDIRAPCAGTFCSRPFPRGSHAQGHHRRPLQGPP